MPREPTIWVVDTSILISYLRAGRHRADVETLRRALGQKIIGTASDDWLLAGRCLARYAERWGQVRPRDHLADALVAVTAARLRATVAAEDVRGMTRWAWALRRLGAEIRVEALTP